MSHDTLLQLLVPLGNAIGTFVGIKVALAVIHVRLDIMGKEIKRAQERIDVLYDR